MTTPSTDDEFLDSTSERARRRKELFEDWDRFYEASTPVAQADTLLRFANSLFHYRNEMAREAEVVRALPLEARLHRLGHGDRVRFRYHNVDESVEMTGAVDEASVACFISVRDDESGESDSVNVKDIIEIIED
jgi:hypothetical protein